MPDTKYLEPSPLMRELMLLECLAAQPHTSQSALGAAVGLTPAMVNTYLKRFVRDGCVRTEPVGKGMEYRLTAPGVHRLDYHRVSYRAELVRLTSAARSHFRSYFEWLGRRGVRSIVLYGAGETADVALDGLASGSAVHVVAIIDDDCSKQGRELHGIRIRASQELPMIKPDAIVIATVAFEQDIRARLADLNADGIPVYSLTSDSEASR